MSTVKRPAGDRLVLSPMEPLTSGRSAEAFERPVQQMLRDGYRHMVIDLARVPSIDAQASGPWSAAIRARAATAAACVSRRSRRRSGRSSKTRIWRACSRSTDRSSPRAWRRCRGARSASSSWRRCSGTLVWAGLKWPLELTGLGTVADELTSGKKSSAAGRCRSKSSPMAASSRPPKSKVCSPATSSSSRARYHRPTM